jgi:alkylation response protein AidB-like acyl-CoA dehydrogenase
MDLRKRLVIEDRNEREWREEQERVGAYVRSTRPITKTRLAYSLHRFERRLARVRRDRTELWDASAELGFAAMTWIRAVQHLGSETADGFRALFHYCGRSVLLMCSVVEAACAALSLIVLRP